MPPRQQTQPLQPAPGLTPVARQVDTYSQPGMVQIGQPDDNNSLIQLGQALKEISPSLNQSLEQYGMMKQKEDVDMGRLLAQRNSTLTTLQELIDKKIITPGMSPAVRKGAMEGLALNAGAVYEAYLKDAWSKSEVKDTDDFEALRTFLGNQRNEFLKKYGQNDPDWAATFQAAATNGERYLSFEHTRHRQQETENAWRRTYEANLGHLVNAEVGKGALFDIKGLVEQIRLAQDERRLQGMSWSDIHDATRANLIAAYEATGETRIIAALQELPLADGKKYKDSQIVNAAIDRAIQQRQSREEALDNRATTKQKEEDRKQANVLKNRIGDFVDALVDKGMDVHDITTAITSHPDYKELSTIDFEQATQMRKYARDQVYLTGEIIENDVFVNELASRAVAGDLSETELREYKTMLKRDTFTSLLNAAKASEERRRYNSDSSYTLEANGLKDSLGNILSSVNIGVPQGEEQMIVPANFTSTYIRQFEQRRMRALIAAGTDPDLETRNKINQEAADATIQDATLRLREMKQEWQKNKAQPQTLLPTPQAPQARQQRPPTRQQPTTAPSTGTETAPTKVQPGPMREWTVEELPPLLKVASEGIAAKGTRSPEQYQHAQEVLNVKFENTFEGWAKAIEEVQARQEDMDKLLGALATELARNPGSGTYFYTGSEYTNITGQPLDAYVSRSKPYPAPTEFAIAARKAKLQEMVRQLNWMKGEFSLLKEDYDASEIWASVPSDVTLADPNRPFVDGERLTPTSLLLIMTPENRAKFAQDRMWTKVAVVPNILWLNKLEEEYRDPRAENKSAAVLFESLNITLPADIDAFFRAQRALLKK